MDRYKVQKLDDGWKVVDTAPASGGESASVCSCNTEAAALVVWRALSVYDALVSWRPDIISDILDTPAYAKALGAEDEEDNTLQSAALHRVKDSRWS